MQSDDWVDFSFKQQGEGVLICSIEEALAFIDSGVLHPETRVTAFFRGGRRVIEAQLLPQLPFPTASNSQATQGLSSAASEKLETADGSAAPPLNSEVAPRVTQVQIRRTPPQVGRATAAKSEAIRHERDLGTAPSAPSWFIPLRRYGETAGRSSRQEFWSFALLVVAVTLGSLILFAISEALGAVAFLIGILPLVIPSITVSIRRLHDINLSGWWLLLHLLPSFIGSAVLMVLFCLPGTQGPNSYGELPNSN